MLVDTLRLIGIPGTNKVMAGELSRLARRALGRRPPEPKKAGTGALVYPFDPELARLAAYYQRTSSRVLWDLCESRARRLEPLHDELRADLEADERAWLVDGARFSIRARNLGAFAAGPRQVVGAVKNAIVGAAAARGARLSVDPERPDFEIALRMHDDAITVSADLVGWPMHERGYRRGGGGAAPLRENLAAVLLMLSRWDGRREVLVDPMAGSGTIAIEAALMARAEPLWRSRRPALHHLPAFAGAEPAREALFADAAPRIVAGDVDAVAVKRARGNAAAAGVEGDIEWRRGDVRELPADELGDGVLILSNPPYGERLEVDPALYRELGDWSRSRKSWRAAFLVANEDFEPSFGERPRVKKPLSNGSQRATFYLYD